MKTFFCLLTLAVVVAPVGAATQPNADMALPAGNVPVAVAAADIQFTRKGKVLEVIDSPMYTYLRVTGDGDPVWLAAYRIGVSEGAVVNYSDGVAMSNFYSKSLDRTFDAIIFVDRIEPEKK